MVKSLFHFYDLVKKDSTLTKLNTALVERARWLVSVRQAVASKRKTRFVRNKLMFIGNGGSGKSSTIRALVGLPFHRKYVSTIVGEANDQIDLSSGNVTEWKLVPSQQGVNLLNKDFGNRLVDLKLNEGLKKQPSKSPGRARAESSRKLPESTIDETSQDTSLIVPIKFVDESVARAQKHLKTRRLPLTGKVFQQLLQRNRRKVPASQPERTFALWDFAGQEIFYTVHHLFLSPNGVYLLVTNLQKLLKNQCDELEVLTFWLESVYLNAGNAPVIIVGTHCLGLNDTQLRELSDKVEALPSLKQVHIVRNTESRLSFFPVENSKAKKYKSSFDCLKTTIGTVSEDSLGQVSSQEIPLSWICFMDHLINLEKD